MITHSRLKMITHSRITEDDHSLTHHRLNFTRTRMQTQLHPRAPASQSHPHVADLPHAAPTQLHAHAHAHAHVHVHVHAHVLSVHVQAVHAQAVAGAPASLRSTLQRRTVAPFLMHAALKADRSIWIQIDRALYRCVSSVWVGV
eukprot:645126-Rhodomonas_salina.1